MLLTNQQYAIMRVAESRHRKSEIKSLGRGYPDTLRSAKKSIRDIASEVGVSRGTVSNVLKVA